MIDSNDQKDDVDENEISSGQNDVGVSETGESSVMMTDDVNKGKGKINVEMAQTDDSEVSNRNVF